VTASACGGLTVITPFAVAVINTCAVESPQPSGRQSGYAVIAHGNRRYQVVSVVPVERLSEFVDEPADGVLEVERL
jgi:hypothetical protein